MSRNSTVDETVNFHQRWLLLYAIRNDDFIKNHGVEWDINSFPSSRAILEDELISSQSCKKSPSLLFPPLDPRYISPLDALKTVSVKNRSVRNVEETFLIHNPRAYDLELIQKEIAFVYWIQKAHRERESYRDSTGNLCLGEQNSYNEKKSLQTWRELIHYKMTRRGRTKINPVLRALGLYAWDLVNDSGIELDIVRGEMLRNFNQYYEIISEYTSKQIKAAYAGTDKSIQNMEVMPMTG